MELNAFTGTHSAGKKLTFVYRIECNELLLYCLCIAYFSCVHQFCGQQHWVVDLSVLVIIWKHRNSFWLHWNDRNGKFSLYESWITILDDGFYRNEYLPIIWKKTCLEQIERQADSVLGIVVASTIKSIFFKVIFVRHYSDRIVCLTIPKYILLLSLN